MTWGSPSLKQLHGSGHFRLPVALLPLPGDEGMDHDIRPQVQRHQYDQLLQSLLRLGDEFSTQCKTFSNFERNEYM